jgi:hypothetical protein
MTDDTSTTKTRREMPFKDAQARAAYKAAYYQHNREKIRKEQQAYYTENKDQLTEKMRESYENNRSFRLEKQKAYQSEHKAESREYRKTRYKNDINFRISVNLRNRLNKSLHSKRKVGSAVKDLGCSIDFLKKYLESQFLPGMSWENHGTNPDNWQIDHIRPLSSFDLSDRYQFLRACHYTNLQPLWAPDNWSKNAKLTDD